MRAQFEALEAESVHAYSSVHTGLHCKRWRVRRALQHAENKQNASLPGDPARTSKICVLTLHTIQAEYEGCRIMLYIPELSQPL